MQETRGTKVLPGARYRAYHLRRTRRENLSSTNAAITWHPILAMAAGPVKLGELRREREQRDEAHGEIAVALDAEAGPGFELLPRHPGIDAPGND